MTNVPQRPALAPAAGASLTPPLTPRADNDTQSEATADERVSDGPEGGPSCEVLDLPRVDDARGALTTTEAERAGIDPATFRYSLPDKGHRPNPLSDVPLAPPARDRSLTDVDGRGGPHPGQNRDKSGLAPTPRWPLLCLLAAGLTVAVCAGPAGGLTGGGGASSALGPPAVPPEAADDKADRTARDILRLAAEHAARRPRHTDQAVGAIYARFSSDGQDSVVDQVSEMLAEAERMSVHVPLEHIYYDLAERGQKDRRPGKLRFVAAVERKAFGVALFFHTSRLFRKANRSLAFVEERLVDNGIRGVFVKQGIDTADGDRWRMALQMYSMIDEFSVKQTADGIRAANAGRFDRGLVYSNLPVGYGGTPTGTVGTQGRPDRRIVVDPAAADWVRRIFQWFAADAVPLDAIARRLTADPAAPRPTAPAVGWTHHVVRSLLANPRYRGLWQYGVTEGRWLSKKDYLRKTTRAEPLRREQREHLRIVSDAVWYAAAR